MPNSASGIVTALRPNARCTKNAPATITMPATIIATSKMVADGCRMMLFGGIVAPRSLIVLSAVLNGAG